MLDKPSMFLMTSLLALWTIFSSQLVFTMRAHAQAQKNLELDGNRSTRWLPPLSLRAQFQLQGVDSHCATGGYNPRVRNTAFDGRVVSPDVYAIDLYADNGACPNYPEGTPNRDAVQAIHIDRKKAVCYVDIGTAEPYRPDYDKFVAFDKKCSGCLLGRQYDSGDPFLNLNNSGATNLLLGQNEVQEANVVNNGYSGQYGTLAGANVNYITKSGGHRICGTVRF
jgi:hypothetical protein